MGGSSRGTFSNTRTPERIQQDIRDAERKALDASFETEVNERMGMLLSKFNERDAETVQARLLDLQAALNDSLEGTVDTVFGGSVAKHTYVDGISDVDTLAILNSTKLATATPQAALKSLEKVATKALPKGTEIERGQIALTIRYADGLELQVLPAIRLEGGMKVPSWRRNAWSAIDPEAFRVALTKRNEQCARKLVPVLKLVKGINTSLPENLRLTGYHIESIGISAFKGYSGPMTYSRMLQHYFEKSADIVLRPIVDRTGQSVKVDEYLGSAGSAERVAVSSMLNRVARRIRNANGTRSTEMWMELFDL